MRPVLPEEVPADPAVGLETDEPPAGVVAEAAPLWNPSVTTSATVSPKRPDALSSPVARRARRAGCRRGVTGRKPEGSINCISSMNRENP